MLCEGRLGSMIPGCGLIEQAGFGSDIMSAIGVPGL